MRSEEVGLISRGGEDHAKVVGNVSPEYIHQDSPLNLMVRAAPQIQDISTSKTCVIQIRQCASLIYCMHKSDIYHLHKQPFITMELVKGLC